MRPYSPKWPLPHLLAAMLALLLGMAALLPGRASAGPADLPAVKPVMACGALAGIDLGDIAGQGSSVTTATATTSAGIAVCNVTVTLAPQIRMQLVLPTESWTQRYLQVGCGGLCGNITLNSGASAGCAVLDHGGFAMAATDMGHEGQDPAWAKDKVRTADFAYRAQHLTALAAKRLIAQFYGQPEKYSYFNGCSDGGREALVEAQRFPKDFDGIIAGAPAMLFQVQNTLYHGWQAVSNTAADGEVILTSAKLGLLHKAVVAACDASDGVTDGLISQPAQCHFDPASLECKAGATDTAQCLSAAQVAVVRKFYEGPRDPSSDAYLTAGQPQPGSELNWRGVYVADDASQQLFSKIIVDPVLKYIAFTAKNPDFQLKDLQFTEATLDALKPLHPLFDATDPDLSEFDAAGGKLILWHGLADQHISPANTVEYQKALLAQMGADAVNGFERLYLLPGVAHCGGGEGPSKLDLLTPMMAWVEGGTAPEEIMTSSTTETSGFGQPDGAPARPAQAGYDFGVAALPDMTRPVWPYPYTASYDGKGDVTKASSWSKGPAAEIVATRDWPGAGFFAPYKPLSMNP